jgi:hypothetical protein
VGSLRRAGVIAGIAVCVASTAAAEQVLVEFGSSTVYLANPTDPGLGTSWTPPGFDDSGWSAGSFGVGFDDDFAAWNLIQTNVPNTSRSVYTRTTFEVADPASIFSVVFGQDYDDGTIVWLNGVEVYRSPEMRLRTPVWNASAFDRESSNGALPDYTPYRDLTDVHGEASSLVGPHIGQVREADTRVR